jgi:hypothetical protein
MWTILTWVLTPLAISAYGYNGVAIASFLVSLTLGITIYLLKKVVDFRLLSSILVPSIGSVIMMIVVLTVEFLFVTDLLTLMISILLGGLVYITVIYLLAKDQIMRDITFIRHKP